VHNEADNDERPTELEAGIVTAFIGAPVLLVLAVTNRTNRRRA